MHMLCKRDSSSDEMDTLRRSRKPTTLLTANGEVQTCEEAQVYVHDLDLFVTVQILEDTPAVLSRGKLFKDPRFCYEWVSGQKPRLTKQGKTIVCKTKNFVHMVVPELSSSSSTSSTSQLRSEVTSSHQELFRGIPQGIQRIHMTVCEIFQNGWRSSQIIYRTQNCLHPHTFLRTQIRNVLREWYQNQGRTVFIYPRPKRLKLRCLLANQDNKVSLQETHWRSSTSSRKVW